MLERGGAHNLERTMFHQGVDEEKGRGGGKATVQAQKQRTQGEKRVYVYAKNHPQQAPAIDNAERSGTQCSNARQRGEATRHNGQASMSWSLR